LRTPFQTYQEHNPTEGIDVTVLSWTYWRAVI
jgi:hypothetical protein